MSKDKSVEIKSASKQARKGKSPSERQAEYRKRQRDSFQQKKETVEHLREVANLGEKVWEQQRTSILQKAMDIVGPAARGLDYGHPLDNFEMEAELMNVWLKFVNKANNPDNKRPDGTVNIAKLNWKDMAIHKLLMKITRECHRHKEDNSVDLAGYAYCLEEAFIENKIRRGKERKGS